MDKAAWLNQWGLIPGTAEAETAWEEKQAFRPIRLPTLISRDIEPYQAMGTDVATGKAPVITSRSHHREYLKRNGYVEVGNESLSRAPETSPTEYGREIKRAIDQVGAKL